MTLNQTWLSPKGLAHQTLLAHFPFGHAWLALVTVGKVMYGLARACARSYDDAWCALQSLARELDYRTTDQMLVEWETALSLPDRCLPASTSIDDRRRWVAFRLDKRRWNTLQDWYDLAAMYGLTVRITPGWVVQRPSLFSKIFPVPIRVFPKLGRFRVYIDVLGQEYGGFPYDGTSITEHKFPIPLGGAPAYISQFRCMIERVAPANILIIWNEFPAVPPHGTGYTFTDDFDTEFS